MLDVKLRTLLCEELNGKLRAEERVLTLGHEGHEEERRIF
jgi:hypothetical protein